MDHGGGSNPYNFHPSHDGQERTKGHKEGPEHCERQAGTESTLGSPKRRVGRAPRRWLDCVSTWQRRYHAEKTAEPRWYTSCIVQGAINHERATGDFAGVTRSHVRHVLPYTHSRMGRRATKHRSRQRVRQISAYGLAVLHQNS